MVVKLADQHLFLLRVCHLKTDKLLLKLVWDSCQDAVAAVLTMFRLALLAVKRAIDLATELGFIRAMSILSAVKLGWIE